MLEWKTTKIVNYVSSGDNNSLLQANCWKVSHCRVSPQLVCWGPSVGSRLHPCWIPAATCRLPSRSRLPCPALPCSVAREVCPWAPQILAHCPKSPKPCTRPLTKDDRIKLHAEKAHPRVGKAETSRGSSPFLLHPSEYHRIISLGKKIIEFNC